MINLIGDYYLISEHVNSDLQWVGERSRSLYIYVSQMKLPSNSPTQLLYFPSYRPHPLSLSTIYNLISILHLTTTFRESTEPLSLSHTHTQIFDPKEIQKREKEMHSDAVLPQDPSNTNEVVISHEDTTPQLNGRKLSWTKLRRADSLDIESASIGGLRHEVVHISFTTYLFYFSLYMLLHAVVHILHILFCFFSLIMIGRRCRVGGGAAAGVPEHRSGVRRYRDVAVVRLLEHVHGWDQTQRRHHRCVVLDSLHSHVNSVDQVCPHRLASQRQRRWYVVSPLLSSSFL